jgi:hypothetical protein
MAAPVKESAWLEWIAGLMGAASRQRQTAMLPPEQFHCLLEELPLHLIPVRSFNREMDRGHPARPLFFSPQCSVLPAGEVPAEFDAQRDLFDGFNLEMATAWVRDPATGFVHPFWLGPQLEATVSRLRAGDPAPPALSSKDKVLLEAAGILVSSDQAERRCAEWAEAVRTHGKAFREKGYAPLANLIHPFNLAALRRYYRHAIRQGTIWLGDEQSPRRYVAHNEKVARYFHHQIANVVSAIAGEPVKPSYVYLASYLSGAALKKHTDRQQCEFSVTLSLDFSPEPELATSWPIRLDTAEGTVVVYQALGDGLVYRGTKLPHYRDALAPGHTSTSIFFHYVAADFAGPLD